jgi:hypothetical protein
MDQNNRNQKEKRFNKGTNKSECFAWEKGKPRGPFLPHFEEPRQLSHPCAGHQKKTWKGPLGLPFSFTKSGRSQVGVDPRPLYNLMGDPQISCQDHRLKILVFLGWV